MRSRHEAHALAPHVAAPVAAPSVMDGERRKPKAPRVTRASLERAAVHHLQRYPCSQAQLRRVLMRRLKRAEYRATGEPPDREQVIADIDEVVEVLAERGSLNDARLAAALAADWLRGGVSPRMIEAKLRQKGIGSQDQRDAIAAALDGAREQGADPEIASAAAYARRRRLGPFRHDPEQRTERRQKDLAALARRGFSFGVARAVIDAEDPDDLPEPLL